jgi:hypothetical protein
VQRRGQVHAIRVERTESGQTDQRWRDVDQRNRRVDHAGLGPRARHDQRHPQCRVVDEDAVRNLAVLAEGFTVVGSDDNHRLTRGIPQRVE